MAQQTDGRAVAFLVILPFLPGGIYFFVNPETFKWIMGEAIWHYKSIWYMTAISSFVLVSTLRLIFPRRYTWIEALIHTFLWVPSLLLIVGMVYTKNTPGLEAFNFINDKVVEVVYEEYYETESCSTDDDGNECCCTCTGYGPYYYIMTGYGQKVDIGTKAMYRKYRDRFGTSRKNKGWNGDISCETGNIYAHPYDPSRPWTMKSTSVPSTYINFAHAVQRGKGFGVDMVPQDMQSFVEPYPTTAVDWGWGKVETPRIFYKGVSGVNTQFVKSFSQSLSDTLAYVSPKRQVNLFIKLFPANDRFQYQAKSFIDYSWLGGQKNDVVLCLGVDNNLQIAWADAISPGVLENLNEEFAIALEQRVLKVGNLRSDNFIPEFIVQITAPGKLGFTRAHTANMVDMLGSIPIGPWTFIISLLIAFACHAGLSWWFVNNDIEQ